MSLRYPGTERLHHEINLRWGRGWHTGLGRRSLVQFGRLKSLGTTPMQLTPAPENHVHPSQRALHDAFAERIRNNYGKFEAIREDGALLGPWSVWLQVSKTGEAIRQLVEAVAAMPGLARRLCRRSASRRAFRCGLRDPRSLYAWRPIGTFPSSGGGVDGWKDSERSRRGSTAAVQLTGALLKGGVVPDSLFRLALEKIGLDGVNRVVFQVGLYCLVSMTLNTFGVPASS